MRNLRVPFGALVAATLVSLVLAGCAMDDEFGLESDESELSEIEADEELLAESESNLLAAAGPSLSLFGMSRCHGAVVNFSGQAVSSSPITLKFKISGGSHTIPHNGGTFSFNPGGAGTLVAKACNASGCTTRSKAVPWISCFPGGGPDPL